MSIYKRLNTQTCPQDALGALIAEFKLQHSLKKSWIRLSMSWKPGRGAAKSDIVMLRTPALESAAAALQLRLNDNGGDRSVGLPTGMTQIGSLQLAELLIFEHGIKPLPGPSADAWMRLYGPPQAPAKKIEPVKEPSILDKWLAKQAQA
jgi:hypothetical protein